MRRWIRGLLAGLSLLSWGCAAGYGSSYPGAQERQRAYGLYERAGPNTVRLIGAVSTTTSDELPFGVAAGLRVGPVATAAGEERITGYGMGFHVKGLWTPLAFRGRPFLGLGLETGYEMSQALFLADSPSTPRRELKLLRMPAVAIAELVPLRPFSLRAGLGWSLLGDGALGEQSFEVEGSPIYQLGASLSVPFLGAHFVHSIDWRRTHAGTLPSGEAWRVDAFLYELQLLF